MANYKNSYILNILGMYTEPLTAEEVLQQFDNEQESQGILIKINESESWIPLDTYLENLRSESNKITEAVNTVGSPPKLKLIKNIPINALAADTAAETEQQTASPSQSQPNVSNLGTPNFNNSSNTTYSPQPPTPTSSYKTSLVSIMMMGFIISVMIFWYLFFIMKQPVTGFIPNYNENPAYLNVRYKIEILTEEEAFRWKNSVKPDLDKLSLNYKSKHEEINPKIQELVLKTNLIVDKYSTIAMAMLQAKQSATLLGIHFDPKSETDIEELRKLESAIDVVGAYLTQDVMTKLANKKFSDLANLIRKSGFDTIKKKASGEIQEFKTSIDLILNESGPIVDESDNLVNTKLFLPNNEFEREDVTTTNTAGEFKLDVRPGRYIIYISPKNDIQETKIPIYWAKQTFIKSMAANKIIVQENEQGTGSPLSVWSNAEVKSLKINHEKLKSDITTLRILRKEIDELTSKMERVQSITVKLD